jgi:hypothetical protein
VVDHSGRLGMKQDDSRVEEILIKMQELLIESRLLKMRHDELTEQYLKLKQELEERAARRRTAFRQADALQGSSGRSTCYRGARLRYQIECRN